MTRVGYAFSASPSFLSQEAARAPRIMTFEQDKYLNMGRLLVFYYLSLVLVSQSIRFDRTPRITYIGLPFCYWPVSEVGILGGGQKDCWIVGSEDKNASTSIV